MVTSHYRATNLPSIKLNHSLRLSLVTAIVQLLLYDFLLLEYGCGRDAPYGQRHSFCPKVLDNRLRNEWKRERNVSYCKKKSSQKMSV